jgi:hypothetical protein
MFGRKNVTLLAMNVDKIPVMTYMEPVWKLRENQAKNQEVEITFQENLVSLSTFDQILDRYPILDKIVEMMFKYLYGWLMIVESSLR